MEKPQDEPHDDNEILEELRAMPVGTNDPNIVGNVGPTDIPPGTDPRDDDELVIEDERRPTAAEDDPELVE